MLPAIQVFGIALFCFVFLFLWRRSGVVYFGLWSVAWIAKALAVMFASRLYIHALSEFTFAVFLVAAAKAGLSRRQGNWRSPLLLLLAFPLFLAPVYLLRLPPVGWHAFSGVVLSATYFYNFATIGGNTRTGGKLFRFTLLFLSLASLRHAVGWWMPLPPQHQLYDFPLYALLTFCAMAMWIETQNDRITGLGDELARVRRESLTNQDLDRLTGLLNQSALARRVEAPGGFTGVISVCDMDNFKDLNDRYGHLVGDEILRNVGHLLRSSIRQQDEAFRWGGDEFVILFQNQNRAVARSRMEEIERRLQDFRVRGYGATAITFSWGTAESQGRTLRETLDEADRDMYEWKRGRKKNK
jgi:diguanylate cyclase (GGDEF)-like protein